MTLRRGEGWGTFSSHRLRNVATPSLSSRKDQRSWEVSVQNPLLSSKHPTKGRRKTYHSVYKLSWLDLLFIPIQCIISLTFYSYSVHHILNKSYTKQASTANYQEEPVLCLVAVAILSQLERTCNTTDGATYFIAIIGITGIWNRELNIVLAYFGNTHFLKRWPPSATNRGGSRRLNRCGSRLVCGLRCWNRRCGRFFCGFFRYWS